jgi:hypothetical protein
VSFDALFLKEYDDKNYNCSHFVVDQYKEITGIDISDLFLGFMRSQQEREVFKNIRKNFRQVHDIKNKSGYLNRFCDYLVGFFQRLFTFFI